MTTPAIPRGNARQFLDEVEKALAEGHFPPRDPRVNGRNRRSAVRVAGEALGIKSGSIQASFEAACRATGRRRDHILTCGHKHTSGMQPVKDPMSGLISWVIRVAGFKKHDRYGKEKGLPDQAIAPSTTTIIDPTKADDDPDLITVGQGTERAAEVLTDMRRRWKRGR